MGYILGIDVGTSLIKAAIYTIEGLEVCLSSINTTVYSPHEGFYEQDMFEVWDSLCKCVVNVMDKSGIEKSEILAIGLTAQGDGCWLIDKAGNPLRKAILWLDGRSSNIIKKWQKKNIDKIIYSINGSVLFPGSLASILKWLEENEHETLLNTRYILYCKDWLKFKLTKTITTDDTDGSIPFFNIRNRSYSKEIFDILELNNYIPYLPEHFPTLNNKAPLSKEAAKRLNLIDGIPVVSGPLDVISTAIGVGAINTTDACSIIGTTCFSQIIMDRPDISPFNIGFTICGTDPNLWIRAMGVMAGTPNLDWILAKLDFEEKIKNEHIIDYKNLEEKLKKIPPLCDGLIYHPFIVESGERAPFVKESIRAQFFGLSQKHSVYHLIRAVYEGIAFSLFDSYNHMPYKIKNIKLAGGGSKSKFWCQIIADLTGCDVITTEGVEFGAFGAAITAMVSEKIYNCYNGAIKKIIKPKKIFYPNNENTKIYRDFYSLYVKIYKDLWNDWDERLALINKYFK
jgi:sugar (pentulose or hexulose) kinase